MPFQEWRSVLQTQHCMLSVLSLLSPHDAWRVAPGMAWFASAVCMVCIPAFMQDTCVVHEGFCAMSMARWHGSMVCTSTHLLSGENMFA